MKNNPTICAVIGYPIGHSMSPAVHNAGYEELGLNYSYKALEFQSSLLAINEMKKRNYRGYSVTIPHKVSIMQYLKKINSVALDIGAVNTIVNENGILNGYNTDFIGAIRSIKEVITLKDKKAVILGAGGAARAIGFGLKNEGVELLIQNRTVEKAKLLASSLSCNYSGINPNLIKNYDIIINTTPIGMYPNEDMSIINDIPKGCVVQDIVYNPLETKLLRIAKKKGCKTISGIGMFLYQAVEQFKLFTGREAPIEKMKQVILEELS